MKRFQNQQRVRLVKPDHAQKGMEGWTGTVVRLRRCDEGAWVQMDRDLPRALAAFPRDDDRARHILLFPDECEPVNPKETP